MRIENDTGAVRERPGPSTTARLARLARRQHGVFTAAQAAGVDVGRAVLARQVHRGTLERPYPGVYRLASAPRTWHADAVAAVYAWGAGTVVSHRAAARLWALPGFERSPVELTVPRGRERGFTHRVHRPFELPAAHRTSRDAIPVTTPTRTLLDIAGCSRADVVEEALDDALRRNLVSLADLTAIVAGSARRGRPGVRLLRALLDARTATTPESVFERRLLRTIVAHGLPRPVLQHEVSIDGRRLRIDLAYPAHRIAIEADGYRWHSSRQALERDAQRQSALAAEGWRVFRVTWQQLEDPRPLVEALRIAVRG